MNDTKRSKIAAFLNDTIASEAVYEVLLEAFLKERKDSDVYILAAKSISLDNLRQAWKDLEKYRPEERKQEKDTHNIGL